MDTDKEQADYYFSLLKSLSKETKFHLVNKLIDSMIEDEEAIQNEREKSLEELHSRIDHSIDALDAGKGISSDEVFSKMEQKYPWLCTE